MNQESIRAFCMSLPHATENVQWGADLCFKVGGKLFCVMCLEPSPVAMSFKTSPENFHALQEVDGIFPAPYMARAQWLGFRKLSLLPDTKMKELIREAHSLVYSGLTRKLRTELEGSAAKPAKKTARNQAKKPAKKSAKKASRKKSAR